MRAVLCAYAAAYATNLALLANFFAGAVGGAGNIYGRRYRYALYDVLGTGAYARSAGYAPFGLNLCHASYNGYCLFGADRGAVAAAEAGSLAHLVAAQKRVAGCAGLIAFIFKCIVRILIAAVALYHCNRRL